MNFVRVYVAIFYNDDKSYKLMEDYISKKLGYSDYISSKISCSTSYLPKSEDVILHTIDFSPKDIKFIKLLTFEKEVPLNKVIKIIKKLLRLQKKIAKLRINPVAIHLGYLKQDQIIGLYNQPSPYRIFFSTNVYSKVEMIYQKKVSSFVPYADAYSISFIQSIVVFFNDVRRLYYK